MENKPQGGQPGNAGRQKRVFSSLLSLILVALMLGLLWSALKVDTKATNSEYYQIIQYFDDGKISEYSLNLSTRKLTYVLKGEKEKKTYTVPSYELFIADVHDEVREYNQKNPDDPIKMNYIAGTSSVWITQMLPMVGMLILMGVMLYWLVKKMGSTMMDDQRRTMAFGKARLKTGDESRKTTFDDVAGLDEEKEDLEEIVEFLKNPQRYNDLGARIPKGVLLVGPPGTGKTLLARAVAGEADAHFLSISGSDFVEMYVGVGASRVRDLFDNAKKNLPSIVFIDEIDAVGRQRGAGMGGGHDEREQTLNQLLVEMDGFGENSGVIIMAATNRPDILDPALLRPGRFDRQITVNYPDVVGREAILKVHAKNKPIGPDVKLEEIARATSGFTGADLENLLNEAALLAARRKKKALTKSEIEEATIKVVVGTEKKSKKIHDDEKRLTAYHEAGHAVTNYYLDTLDPVHQVSIIPRGMAGGFTMSLPKDDKSYVSKKHMLDELVSLLGGRVSEAIILGDISTGASNDIERATKIARNMIIKYGMSDKLGPICYGSGNDEVFIGRDYGHVKNYSEETASLIDKEVESIITAAYDRADEILRVHIDKLHELAKYLMEFEKIDGPTFEKLMAGTLNDVDEPVVPVVEEKEKTVSLAEPEKVEEEITETPIETTVEEEPEVVEEPKEETVEEVILPETDELFAEENNDTDDSLNPDVQFTASTLAGDISEFDETQTVDSFDEYNEPIVADFDDGTDIADGVVLTESTKAGNVLLEDSKVNDDVYYPEDDIEPAKKDENSGVELSEAELQFKRELDRENGLISAEDQYADSKVFVDEDADINDYLEETEKPKKIIEEEPEIEGLSGSTGSLTEEELIASEGMRNVGSFLNSMATSYDLPKKEDVISEPIEPEEEEVEEEEEFTGTFTENDEIYALYELLKDTRDFGEDDSDNPFEHKDK